MPELSIVIGTQRTGQGHTARTLEIIRHARNHGEVHLVTSGTQSDLPLPQPPDIDLKGLSFGFGRRGGIDLWATWLKINPLTFCQFLGNVLFRKLPGGRNKIVISDFEPYTAWRARLEGVPSIQLSHQAAFYSQKCPRPRQRSVWAEYIMRWFARCDQHVGIHYEPYDSFIKTPVIRQSIRQSEITRGGHYTVYLPAYSDAYVVRLLKRLPHVQWEVFNRHHGRAYVDQNVRVSPINEPNFVRSLASCNGLLTMAGVQSTSEALFLGKKLLTVPVRGQYEQACNAAALKRLGVPQLRRLDESRLPRLRDWINDGDSPQRFLWPDHTAATVSEIVGRLTRQIGSRQFAAGEMPSELLAE